MILFVSPCSVGQKLMKQKITTRVQAHTHNHVNTHAHTHCLYTCVHSHGFYPVIPCTIQCLVVRFPNYHSSQTNNSPPKENGKQLVGVRLLRELSMGMHRTWKVHVQRTYNKLSSLISLIQVLYTFEQKLS